MTKQQQYTEEPIAIVGSACRFPGGSNSPAKLWDLLRDPRDVLKEFDPDRLNLSRFHHHDGEVHGSTNVTNSSYILEGDTRVFDAAFFGINPVEAAGMDPQQRVLLETVYEAIESASMGLEQLKGSLTSVHVGVMSYDWTQVQYRDPETAPQYTATGTAASILANRISYIFDLRGPSVTIDTACSSSLVALHHAARGLLDGDSEAAIVTGVNLILDPSPYIAESKLHMLSPESRSRMWDKAANGYARGEGTAALLLKTLSRALADGDHIEGVVRATAVNSDGLSPGITMPVAQSQTALIRHTYRRAGLDPVKDRPQYFECHGTGTPAGDPVEARAVSDAFVSAHVDGATSVDNPMYVGSIKTVVGHLEGCAGLAGIMKVLLAIKHRTIPPNLLFKELNPAVAPYYGPLLIPTKALPWPKLPPGTPARASVNSFGFGGTNAHAIIESFEAEDGLDSPPPAPLGPLVFSAASGSSLLRIIRAYLEHLRAHPELDLGDLSWLLQTRRSTHRVRAHFSGVSRSAILESMDGWVASHEKALSGEIGYQPRLVNPKEVPGVLGVFTGQGAQWPAMGRELIEKSPLFRNSIEECEAVLRALPVCDAPTWSLAQELAADVSSSRLAEAAISQPLCTAVQLGLVDLLAAAGIHFDAVVGHSSGEIAAVYASGIITRAGAMQIAYYRGFHARLAQGAEGQRGGMMAAALSLDKATQLCDRPEFSGRLTVAASNAPQSVTVSGDLDAVDEARKILKADGIFVRKLKVDTAYHSHHMQPCAEPYFKSMLACDIQIQQPKPGKCVWSSSVRGNTELLKGDNLSTLKGPYWVANMMQTVLFSQAVESSIWHGGPFDLAIEVGPHPALKGPAEQILKAAYGSVPPYSGTLRRACSNVQAFSAAVGTVWAQLGPSAINFAGYHAAFSSLSKFQEATIHRRRVLKDLPAYAWDHDKVYWRESATSRRYRTSRDSFNALLGRRTPDDNAREPRWRNVLRLAEMPWLRGHEILGEVLVPGATYVSFAIEACRQIGAIATTGREDIEVCLFEVENLDILRPLVVPHTKDGVETLFTARLLDDGPSSSMRAAAGIDRLRAQFSYYVCVDPAAGTMVHTCTGELAVHFRKPTSTSYEGGYNVLPPRDPLHHTDLVAVDWRRIYAFFEGLGLNHQGPLRAIKECSRRSNYATATAIWSDGSLDPSDSNDSSDIMTAIHVHPAMLDVAFQTVLVAHAHPSSGQITAALLPSHIDRVRVSPTPIASLKEADPRIDIEGWAGQKTLTALTGDVNVYDTASGATLVQAEGLQMRMLGEPDAAHDRPLFAKTVWARDFASMGGLLQEPDRDAAEDAELLALSEACERVALFYARRLVDDLESAGDDWTAFQLQHRRFLGALNWHLALGSKGEHPTLRCEWLADGPDILRKMDAAHPGAVQLHMLHALGSRYTSIIRGEVTQLEIMTKNNLLNRFYMEDLECIRINQFLANALRQITVKYPRCNILEIGAGTGGTTLTALSNIDDAYASYTFTDISSAFLSSAADEFADVSSKMIFKTLDIDNDPAAQGYTPHSYDIVIAANVLHATRDLTRTMRHVRSMLRPGGYLLLFETTGVETLSIPFIFGGLSSWWVSQEADRNMGPIVRPLRWDAILQDSGFSGLDMVAYDTGVENRHTTALLVSQAINDTLLCLREPLTSLAAAIPGPDALLLIGGRKLATAKMLAEIQKLLPRTWRRCIETADSIDAAGVARINPGSDVICLQDEDEPLFATTMTPPRLLALQGLLMKARNLLWVTSATTAKTAAPRAAMFHGIARVAPVEMPHLNLQVLGLEAGMAPATAARHCVESFLRLGAMAGAVASSKQDGDHDGDEGTLLWAREVEVEVLATGETLIPRVVEDSALNEVYAASRRIVTQLVDASALPVRAVPGPARMMLQRADDLETETDTSASPFRVQVKYTLHIPAKTGDGIYLTCGTQVPSRSSHSPRSVMAMSNTNASILAAPPGHLVAVAPEACTPEMLVAVANRLLIRAVGDVAARTGKSVLLYGADVSLASELAIELDLQDIRAHFASSDPLVPDSWIKVHAQSSKRVMQRAVPLDVALFIDCTSASRPSSAVANALRDCLAPGCKCWQLDAQLLGESSGLTGAKKAKTATLLEDAYAYTQKTKVLALSSLDCDVMEAAALSGVQVTPLVRKRYVTDWQKRKSLPLTVPPLDTRGLFRPDRTYLMVGAAGGLGLSICKWILANGAKHMTITSRNPRVDPAFLEDAHRAGACVHVLPMDVGNKTSVDSVVAHVRATMPPIAGVCNAAMVLSDRLFLDMDVGQLNGTLAPKVDGSEHLDTAFANETQLEFFIMLSSSASVLGNVGQANYHMANLFMTSLAAARRARGLAGSVVHVGHITDVGYVATGDRTEQLEEHFRTLRLMPLSETDVHHAFAQAIRGGRPGSQVASPDIIMGVEPPTKPVAADVAGRTESKIPWLANSRLSHLVPILTLDREGGQQGQSGARDAGNVLQRVEHAGTEEEAVASVLEAFCAKLDSTLQLPQGYTAENVSRAAIDLGIDSLVAVEIRTWFLKELGAEIPVVNVLGGDSVLQICTAATAAVMAKRVKIKGEAEPQAEINGWRNGNVKASPNFSPSLVSVDVIPAPATVPALTPDRELEPDNSTSLSGTNNGLTGPSSPSQDAHSSEISSSVLKLDDSASTCEAEKAEGKNKTKGYQVTETRPKVIRQERMSRAQARIWFLSKHLDDPAAYNMVFLYRIHGTLSMTRLRHALQVVTHHHECLRMCFYQRVGDGHGMQGLMASSAYELEHVRDADEADLHSTMARFKAHVWDLEAGRTMGLAVLSRGPESHDFVLGYHHIISDVVGTHILLQDLDRAYRMQPLDKIGAGSHLDYTAQLLEREAAGVYDEPLKFWRAEFATLPDPLPLLPQATVHTRPAAQQITQQANKMEKKTKKKMSTHSEYHTLPHTTVAAVKATCRRLRISSFHFYLGVFQVLLARSAGIEDVCIGVVDANRGDRDQITRMVGCFVNMLPVRGHVSRTASFADVAREASRKALAAFSHAGVPFDVLLDVVQAPRWYDGATAPLVQAAVNYRAAGWGQLPLGAECRMALRLDDGKDAETPYDVSLGLMDLAEGCTIDLHTRAALYGADATRGMLQIYVRLVTAFAANSDMRVDKCPLHDEAQVKEARLLGTGSKTNFGWPATLSQRLRDMCRLHSAKSAIRDESETQTYSQLAGRVNAVAKALLSAGGTTPGDRVAVLCEPSVDAVVALLAILQIGCVYVPLDTSLPAARHAAIIESCKPRLLLYHTANEESVLELGNETSTPFSEMRLSDIVETESYMQVPCASDPASPAILLFTSGSTGTPKGILLTQGNFANHIALKTQSLDLGPKDRVLQQSSLGFDMSLVQTFCALANGGCLVVVPRDARSDPVALTALLREQDVSLTIATPSEYLTWLHYGDGSLRDHAAWRHACMGGELVSTELKREFSRLELKGLRLTNCYGPTEITAAATFQTIDPNDYADGGDEDAGDGHEQHQRAKYAVGKVLPNYSVCILDSEGRPQPVQHTGELCIGGAGVALGYLNLAGETRAKFITDPMNSACRLYRTGDKGCLLPDGTLLCFGRLDGDTQIKLRGLRVELQEVETALLRAANGLLSTVVVSRRGDILVAHATASPGHKDTVGDDELAKILERLLLPQYFVPAAIVVLPALPTNTNGKLDRKAIAAMPLPTSAATATTRGDADSREPREKMNIREGELRLLWERVLPAATATMGRIVPLSDFFLRGGNSLLLMRLQSAIRESMGVTVSTRALYRASTLTSMARTVQEAREAATDAAGDPEDINWAAEAALPAELKQQVHEILKESAEETVATATATKTRNAADGLEIVLTGAAGFLGGRILNMLLQSSVVRTVHCIAVLADDAHLLPRENRIRCYTGSLADPTLGLNTAEHALLSQASDVIIHAGSDGHCLNNYATLRAPNVASTQKLAALALPRAVPLLFVSSYRVALLGGRTAQPAASMSACPPPRDGREGLTASKWVAETFLENLASYYCCKKGEQQRKWTVAIHRPCVVVGEQAPNSDSMNAILRFSLSMHCVPLLKHGRGYIDFAPVDSVAAGVTQAALQMAGLKVNSNAAVDGQVQFKHHSSNTKVPVDGFGAHLENVYGGRFEELPMREWMDRASAAGIDPLITAYLDGVVDTDEEMVFPYLGKDE